MKRPHLNRDQLAYIFGDIEVTAKGCWTYMRIQRGSYYQGNTDDKPTRRRWPGFQDDDNAYGYIYSKAHELKGRAHRVLYNWAVSKLRRGFVIDHLCRNKACCNPAHLEQVRQRTNARRARRPQ